MAKMVIKIDEELCNGCGECISPCVEGALALVDGKAKVISEELCDGAGVCLGACPMGALSLEPKEESNKTAMALSSDKMPGGMLQCSLCRRSEAEHYLLQIRKGGQSQWVCTRCLPGLIHG